MFENLILPKHPLLKDARRVFIGDYDSHSRGLAGASSDYDVIMVVARPPKYYLTMSPNKDTFIVRGKLGHDRVNVTVQDIFKTMHLAKASNHILLDALHSKFQFDPLEFGKKLCAILKKPNLHGLARHYIGISVKPITAAEITNKELLFLLWAVGRAMYIVNQRRQAPIELDALVYPDMIREAIEKLKIYKHNPSLFPVPEYLKFYCESSQSNVRKESLPTGNISMRKLEALLKEELNRAL